LWNNNYLFEVELLQHFQQFRKLSRAARIAFAGRVLCRPGLHDFDRQLQPSTRVSQLGAAASNSCFLQTIWYC